MGRSFFSSVKGGLWVSLIIRIADISKHFSINRALSLAICDSVLAVANFELKIKWPNDLYCNRKKICGILLETAGTNQEFIIAGFGLNVNLLTDDFPEDLRDIATSVLIETGQRSDLNDIFQMILDTFCKYLKTDEFSAHEKYCSKLYRIGDYMELEGIQGIFDGVESDGRLRLDTKNSIRHFVSGTPVFVEHQT
jgi:biotin-[acetyl-CoA-carboxylase] ligase BirA-like protein